MNLNARFEYLKTMYEPHRDCIKEAKFSCDFRPDGDEESDMCPCQWALSDEQKKKIDPKFGDLQ